MNHLSHVKWGYNIMKVEQSSSPLKAKEATIANIEGAALLIYCVFQMKDLDKCIHMLLSNWSRL